MEKVNEKGREIYDIKKGLDVNLDYIVGNRHAMDQLENEMGEIEKKKIVMVLCALLCVLLIDLILNVTGWAINYRDQMKQS